MSLLLEAIGFTPFTSYVHPFPTVEIHGPVRLPKKRSHFFSRVQKQNFFCKSHDVAEQIWSLTLCHPSSWEIKYYDFLGNLDGPSCGDRGGRRLRDIFPLKPSMTSFGPWDHSLLFIQLVIVIGKFDDFSETQVWKKQSQQDINSAWTNIYFSWHPFYPEIEIHPLKYVLSLRISWPWLRNRIKSRLVIILTPLLLLVGPKSRHNLPAYPNNIWPKNKSTNSMDYPTWKGEP